MPVKLLPIALPDSAYAELARRARSQERDPIQQARFILKQALAEKSTDDRAAVGR